MSAIGQNSAAGEHEEHGALDVAAVMAKVRFAEPRETVVVRGIVGDLRPWPNAHTPVRMYGDLLDLDRQSKMSFSCSLPVAPTIPGEHVFVRGTLTLKPFRNRHGFELLLTGGKIGAWTPSETAASVSTLDPAALTRLRPKLSLERFLLASPGRRLVLIGTKRAIGDVQKTFDRGSRQLLEEVVSTTGVEALLPVITEAAQKYDGLCFVRGGGEANSFDSWNDTHLIEALLACGKPFYTALGHSDDFTLADKHADESFATPSDLGGACAFAWEAQAERDRLQSRLERQSRKISELERASDSAKWSELDGSTRALQSIVEELRYLPTMLNKQTGQSITAAVRNSVQENFRQPIQTAVKGPLAELQQTITEGRLVLEKLARRQTARGWPWLLALFLFGMFAGGIAYHVVDLSRLDTMENELQIIRQQTVPVSDPAPNPAPVKKKARGIF